MTKKYQLKNGMNVVLVESHKSPVVSVQMWVKTGSADEKKGLEGISHFIEHLVFKGSEKFAVGEIASAVEQAGGVLNAYTTFDQTVFYVTLSKEFVDTGLEVIAEMMGRPRFDQNEIANEREVVIEEIKRGLDSPQQQASRHLFSSVYKKHPYGIPVIGYDDNIRRVSRKSLLNYYHSRYVPQNMNLVVVGDFQTPDLQKRVAEKFGEFKRYKLMKIKRAKESAKKKTQVSVKQTKFAENYIYLTWPVPGAKHKDSVALSIFAAALGQGESSRLYRQLRNEKQLVNSISSSVFSPREPGFMAVAAITNKERLVQATEEICKQVSQVLSGGVTEQEIERAVRNIESEKYYSMETVDGLASLYGYYEFIYQDPAHFEKFIREASTLSAEAIMAVGKKYLDPQKAQLVVMTDQEPTSLRTQLEKTLKAHLTKAPANKKRPTNVKKKSVKKHGIKIKLSQNAKRPKPEIHKLSGGATLLVLPQKESPVVSARFGFLGGLRYEPKEFLGVNELTTRIWTAGTKKRSEDEINHAIESMSAGIGAFGGRNSLGLSMTSLSPDAGATREILTEILLEPLLSEFAIDREKMLMGEIVKSRRDKPSQRCMQHLQEMMFKGHPYSRDSYGEVDSIAKLNRSSVDQYLSRVLNANGLVVSVVGDIDLAEWIKSADAIAQKLSKSAKQIEIPAMQNIDANLRHFEEMNKEQTHMAVAYRGIKVGDKDRIVLEVMQSILSGQGGRLFIELRDKASLAYSVSPIRMDGLEGGYFGAYIGCSPDKVTKAFAMMQQEFNKLSDERISSKELDRAKQYLLGRHDIALQRTGHVADLMLFDQLYGLPYNDFENFKERLGQVTAESIMKMAQKIFSQNYCLSVVGQKDVSI